MKEKLKSFFNYFFAPRRWIMHTLWSVIVLCFVYQMWDAYALHQWTGVSGYGTALIWFALYVMSDTSNEFYRKAYRTAMDGWKEALDGYQAFAGQVEKVASTSTAVEQKPQSSRKGRTLGLK